MTYDDWKAMDPRDAEIDPPRHSAPEWMHRRWSEGPVLPCEHCLNYVCKGECQR